MSHIKRMLYVAYIVDIEYSSGHQKRNLDLDAGETIKRSNETERKRGRKNEYSACGWNHWFVFGNS